MNKLSPTSTLVSVMAPRALGLSENNFKARQSCKDEDSRGIVAHWIEFPKHKTLNEMVCNVVIVVYNPHIFLLLY
jgi:hypothetical protein